MLQHLHKINMHYFVYLSTKIVILFSLPRLKVYFPFLFHSLDSMSVNQSAIAGNIFGTHPVM